MCGLFGHLGYGTTGDGRGPVELQSALLRHRGPDEHGVQAGNGWLLGFRRLAILDLSPAGSQPMWTPDGRFCLAFNGEIYNAPELRRELGSAGVRFRGSSDTEVLLHLLARRGTAALSRLNGMFAFALIDTVERRATLGRDRLGKKPLYYTSLPGGFRFASELKALLAWDDAPTELDEAALADYLVSGWVSGERCIFRGYRKLLPGHVLTVGLDDLAPRTSRWWQLELDDSTGPTSLADGQLDELQELLSDAVRIRLRSDVPVGTFLSAGIDSGLVTTLVGRSAAATPPLALTVALPGEDKDEVTGARAVAAAAGLPHRVLTVDVGGLGDVDRLAWFYDEPFADPSALPTMALCAAAAEHATVFLSGDGGDEAFAGYQRYVETRRYTRLMGVPRAVHAALGAAARLTSLLSPVRYQLMKAGLPDQLLAASFDGIPNDPVLTALTAPGLRPALRGATQRIADRWAGVRRTNLTGRQQAFDYDGYLPDDILVKVDRASMAASIEVRSPFLDHRLVEWAARLPRSVLLNDEFGKLPLRALSRRLLPAGSAQAPKFGFGVPLDAWFRQPAGEAFVRDRLLGESGRDGVWDRQTVARLLAQHQQPGGRSFGIYLWRLLVLDAWMRHYVDDKSFLRGALPALATTAD